MRAAGDYPGAGVAGGPRGGSAGGSDVARAGAQLLTSGLPALDPAVAEGLLAVTGRWPLLLRLVNKILADYARMAPDVSAQAATLLERLRAGGPAVVDDLAGSPSRGLDVGQPQERALAVRATIEASTSLLAEQDKERFAELGVFAEDETIPFSLLAEFWRTTAGLDELATAQVVEATGPAGAGVTRRSYGWRDSAA